MCEREVLHQERHAGASHREEGEHANERRRPHDARYLRGLERHRKDGADRSHGDEHPERGDVDVEVAPIDRRNRDLNRKEHRPGERKQITHADGEVVERHEHELPVERRASSRPAQSCRHRCISLSPAARRHRSGRGLCRTSTHRAAWQATGAPRAHASLCCSATQRVKTERFAPPRWAAVTVTRGGTGAWHKSGELTTGRGLAPERCDRPIGSLTLMQKRRPLHLEEAPHTSRRTQASGSPCASPAIDQPKAAHAARRQRAPLTGLARCPPTAPAATAPRRHHANPCSRYITCDT